ncbi:SMI1/KNR4 family protein [Solibacillus sp. FSL W8-0372]|uniref:SMI1/KNR4 family protein n=1 Tax=Solibacillus sp. FSL W8-0372 TaxID=2921713 RepID=UPI0030D0A77E
MKNIWCIEEGKEKLTDDMVKNAEKKLGVTLPDAYIELCKIQNGGYITYDAFPTSVPTGWAEDHISVDHIRGIEEEGILSNDYYIEEWDLPKDIILLGGDGHTWTAMDYRKTKENPPIIYIDLEWGDDIFILQLAPDFAAFVDGLFHYDG